MRVVGLISGGKDSCYNMMQCVMEGHQLVALANLKPHGQDEMDSYMYQTVGHHAIDLYAQAMQLPLFRKTIRGSAVETGRDYKETSTDEVEDLFVLLTEIKDSGVNFDAVSVGAILSDYQRVRVENVCSRLGVTSLAYLWRRDQNELLQEMIAADLKAIIIKVAALGLTPEKHLGHAIDDDFYRYMTLMNKQYGLNVCGEGGEYETFTLDCPLFVKKIVLDEAKTVIHSDDAFAPVAYLNLEKMHLEDKTTDLKETICDKLVKLGLKSSCGLLRELSVDLDQLLDVEVVDEVTAKTNDFIIIPVIEERSNGRPCNPFFCLSGITARCATSSVLADQVTTAMDRLSAKLHELHCTLKDVVAVNIYVSNMANFITINNVYKKYFSHNPPVRACVEIPLDSEIAMLLDCTVHSSSQFAGSEQTTAAADERRMHVQSLSHWAPANIGPYSQCVQVGRRLYVAGQIGLVPATMTLVEGGVLAQCRLCLRHVCRVLSAMNAKTKLRDVTLAVCFLTSSKAYAVAEAEWQRALTQEAADDQKDGWGSCSSVKSAPLVLYVLVSALPRQALVEWQVVASSGIDNWLGESSSRYVGTSSCIVRCHWRVDGEQQHNSSSLSYLVRVDSPSDVEMPLIEDIWLSVVHRLKDLLNKHQQTHQQIVGLKVFVKSTLLNESFQLAYCSAYQSAFECDAMSITSTSFVPVCGFPSTTSAIFYLCSV